MKRLTSPAFSWVNHEYVGTQKTCQGTHSGRQCFIICLIV